MFEKQFPDQCYGTPYQSAGGSPVCFWSGFLLVSLGMLWKMAPVPSMWKIRFLAPNHRLVQMSLLWQLKEQTSRWNISVALSNAQINRCICLKNNVHSFQMTEQSIYSPKHHLKKYILSCTLVYLVNKFLHKFPIFSLSLLVLRKLSDIP